MLTAKDIVDANRHFMCPFCGVYEAPLQYTPSAVLHPGHSGKTSLFMHLMTRHATLNNHIELRTYQGSRQKGYPCMVCGDRMDRHVLTGYVYGFRLLVHMIEMDDASRAEHVTALAMMGLL
jgi:hypothetical protein